jgi:ribonuclease-3
VPELTVLQTRLGYQFQNEQLLKLALTHPSIAHEQDTPTPHNQRLEFLGDSILGLVLSRDLYEKFPDADEGLLTKSRAKLVNSSALHTHACALNLGDYLILSRGEELTGGRERPSTLADAYEALLGAVFLDAGFEATREIILREFSDDFSTLGEPAGIDNPKGELQELLQTRSTKAPQYHILSVTGPDHDRQFACAVFHEDRELARGSGRSKKAAESDAALNALKHLQEAENRP